MTPALCAGQALQTGSSYFAVIGGFSKWSYAEDLFALV